MELVSDKNFYKTFAGLTLSLMLRNLLTYSVNLMDNVMLGAYSETALAGSSLCNQYQFLLQMIVTGAGQGVVIVGTQYWGKKDLEPIPHFIGIALRYALVPCAVMFFWVLLFPAQAMGLLTNEADVVAEGVKYIQIIAFSYFLFIITNTLTVSLQTIGIVKIGYVISATTLCINVVLNYLLIYGNFGFPELGIRGAALATLTSRMVELIIVIWYLKYREHELDLNLRKLIFIDGSYNRDYFHVAFPMLLNEAQWGVAQMVQTGILGHLGGIAIAANSIATIVFQIISVAAYGSAAAAGIMIGKTIGEGRDDRLKVMVHTIEIIFICIGVVTGLAIYGSRYLILSLYNISEETHTLALQFMAILSITVVGTSYQMACDTGIIRGGGDTSFSAKMNLISMWFIVVPLASLAAFVLHWPSAVVFFLLKWDQLYKIIPVTIRLHSWKWVRHVTR